ncbi:DUF6364 family protein [Hydrogenimonas sp.]
MTKITLYSDEKLIKEAKRYAKEHGTSLSKLTTRFFETLAKKRREKREEGTPLTDRLQGVLKGSGLDEEAYRRYLEEKYR